MFLHVCAHKNKKSNFFFAHRYMNSNDVALTASVLLVIVGDHHYNMFLV